MRFLRQSGVLVAILCGTTLALLNCKDDPISPTIGGGTATSDLGDMPDVPIPTSMTSEAESDTVTVIKPLLTSFAPIMKGVKGDWVIRGRSCKETMWIPECGGWSVKVSALDTWFGSLPEQYNYRPESSWKVDLLKHGVNATPKTHTFTKHRLNWHNCDCVLGVCWSDCWDDREWSGTPPELTEVPYLCRDRFWMVSGKSQILPPGFEQEITTTVTRGVEKTECDEWAVSLTVEGEVTNGYATLKSTIEASYSKSVTKTVYEETSVETKYTPEAVSAGNQAVYQVWVLVDATRSPTGTGSRLPIPATCSPV